MLLTELILSKRGPLTKVWLSAHHERKLSKQQALGVDVEESCDAILTQEDGSITLRLSGQLMLGVTRIYSRKVQYLLDDCKETRERISLAFRPGVVDLPEDQIRASKNAITFADVPSDFNYLDWTWAAPPAEFAPRGLHTAPAAQINLRPATREFGAYNFGRPIAPSIYGGSASSRHPSQDVETSSHLDSQDFSGIDLGLNLDQQLGDISVEAGREAATPLSRGGSVVSGRRRDTSFGGGSARDVLGMDISFEPIDLGLDLGPDQPELPILEQRSRRETSALSTPPPVSPPALLEMTPRTAARMQKPVPPTKVKRPRLLQADEELELPDEQFAAPQADSLILTEERYIPSDPDVIRFNAIAADPNVHFLPTVKIGGVSMIYAGPEGLAPELAELFTFPSNILRRDRGQDDEAGPTSKRPRIEEDDIEVARRGSMPPLSEVNMGIGIGDDTFALGFTGEEPGVGDMTFDDLATPRRKQPSLPPPRAESIARAIHVGEEEAGDHPLSIFQSARNQGESQNQSQLTTPSKSVVSEERSRTSTGYSRNTGLAMGLLRKEIEAIEEEDKILDFETMAKKASRKEASAFFFELLVLGTRDSVKLDQPTAFGNIAISAKPKLWEEVVA